MRRTLKYVLPALAATHVGLSGCRASMEEAAGEGTVKSGTSASTYDGTVPQIMDAAKIAKIKAALPKVAFAALQTMLESPATLWYDKESMPGTYQDSVGDVGYTPVGARLNSEGKGLIVPEGKKLFSDDGQSWAYPFGHTAGLENTDNAVIVNFLNLPTGTDGKPLPVVYSTVDDPSGRGGLGLHQWTWMYPRGATVGEMIFIKDSSGALFPSELRIRTRYLDGWATNSFRPFPTAASLAAAIKAARPEWSAKSNLKTVVDHLESDGNLVSRSVSSPAFNNVFKATGGIDTIPDFGDDALVKELLTKTTFTSAYGEAWKTSGSLKSYAASTKAAFSIVPRNNTAGLIEVTDESCARCHEKAGDSLNNYADAVDLYGDLWGEDRVFSFHPYDPKYARGAPQVETRFVRPAFKDGIVVRYEKGRHPSDLYKKLAGP